MFWPRTWIHPRILMICPSHTPRSTHFKKKMVYCTSLHFLRHEQCKDGMGFWKHHVYFDEAGTSTPHRKTLQVWTKRPLRPRSSKVGDDAFSQQTKRVAVRPFTLQRVKHRLQCDLLDQLFCLWILYFLLSVCFPRRAWVFFSFLFLIVFYFLRNMVAAKQKGSKSG